MRSAVAAAEAALIDPRRPGPHSFHASLAYSLSSGDRTTDHIRCNACLRMFPCFGAGGNLVRYSQSVLTPSSGSCSGPFSPGRRQLPFRKFASPRRAASLDQTRFFVLAGNG